ncbi:MAG: hypothetical protein DIZ80_02110 [endosymbiont of Galathealinum brachiosum]|uniref:Uncharacterized protein n=1 Tax=endosymbiont of Galathealinum brachiosum TaxID=2200906 RepID=A0A370DLM1_9GAMM|nr:MAG: hypothetical protein DIZ80_02110 [endosymbiont of Galathealinum brachiosum]
MSFNTSIAEIMVKNKVITATCLLLFAIAMGTPFVTDAIVTDKNEISYQSNNQKQALNEKWGIELVAMRSVASGHMVDFRYRVLDAVKSAPLFVRQTKPYLIHQETGKSLGVPNTAKLGSLRNSNTPQEGRTYWMFFGNHHRLVHKGDKVTVAIGDFRVTDIEVE